DRDSLDPRSAAHDAAADLHSGIELDRHRRRRGGDALRAKCPGGEPVAFEENVVRPFLEPEVERAVAAGADDVLVATVANHRPDDAANGDSLPHSLGFDRLHADPGKRAAVAIG